MKITLVADRPIFDFHTKGDPYNPDYMQMQRLLDRLESAERFFPSGRLAHGDRSQNP
ncbi:hypothetical protein [Bacillus atrophaeus]|uniref:hypothetical protein n=1 Tax=Bacillus atrophaeus TaxID=1452 RepID=UPI0022830FF2|nr:hypothetical protein [Bacillus atrophaeus]MCY8478039.1 hypothetical protein [Bacillus atrophaeus]